MSSTAMNSSRLPTTTGQAKTIVADPCGLHKQVKDKGLHKWVYVGQATIVSGFAAEDATALEAGTKQSWFVEPVLGSGILAIPDTFEAAVRALDIGELAFKPYEQPAQLAEASTVPAYLEGHEPCLQRQRLSRIEEHIDGLFRLAVDENFEDGMASDFSRELLRVVREHGNSAMGEITYLILYDRVSREVASEALRWLGRMTDSSTYGWRLWLLHKSLSSPSVIVRDGALLGLAAMGDRTSMPYLHEAITKEACAELRDDLQQALKDLEAALSAAVTQEDPQG